MTYLFVVRFVIYRDSSIQTPYSPVSLRLFIIFSFSTPVVLFSRKTLYSLKAPISGFRTPGIFSFFAASISTTWYSTCVIAFFFNRIHTEKQTQLKNTVKQFKAGEYMSDGWASEAIIGMYKDQEKKVGGITYKALNNTAVSVVAIPNKKSVSIPDQVQINGKNYNVTQIAKNSMKGSKVRTVTLGANVKKIAAKAFAKSKVTKIVLKTTKLKKSTVKGSLDKSVVKTIKVSVSKALKAKTVKKYKKYFRTANSKSTRIVKVK